MDDLAERIKAAIENPDGELWFPDLTADLAARAWKSLQRDLGLTPHTYGTERILSCNPSAPREIITHLKTCSSTCPTPPTISIEALTPACPAQYQQQGVTFYTPDEILHSPVLSCIEEALGIINQVPSLMRTVATLVRSLHVIKPADEDHDVSFSEPHVPFSIFVSVPEKRIANDALRVAEAVVHEAMHLQLTLIQSRLRFLNADGERYFSPWRGQFRTAGGMLHGLYVFSVIKRFLGEVQLRSSDRQGVYYALDRRMEIQNQLGRLHSFQHSEELTEIGAAFAGRLMDGDYVTSLRQDLSVDVCELRPRNSCTIKPVPR
jgi:hypothetical protein